MSRQPDKGTIGFSAIVIQETAKRQMEGVLRHLEETPGFRLRDFRLFSGPSADDGAPPPPWKGKADGVIITMGLSVGETAQQVYRWLRRGGVPVVSLVPDWVHPGIPVVSAASDAVMRLAAGHLVGKGHRHFAYIGKATAPEYSASCHEVFNRRLGEFGYRALRYDLSFRPGVGIEKDGRVQHETGLARFLCDAPKPLGVFAATDYHARVVCMLCGRLGLDVPEEVAVLGCGNLATSRCSSPTLSSVQIAEDGAGYEAMKLLHRLMRGGRAPRRPKMIPPVRVIERESSCPGFQGFGDTKRAQQIIREFACEGIRVADVVRHLSVSRRTLEDHFRRSIGHSPGEEISLVRLERAKELLKDTDLSMTVISGMLGFSEPPRFSTFFQKHVGFTPSDYRRGFREGA